MGPPESGERQPDQSINQVKRRRKEREPKQGEQSAAIASALAAIRDQLKAHNERQDREEQRQPSSEHRKIWFDILTVLFVFATAVFTGLSWLAFREQVNEMKAAYGPIRDSAVAAKQSGDAAENSNIYANRAWIGVGRLEFTRGIDSPGGPVIMVYFQNVGRFPALDIRTGGTWLVMPLAKVIERTDAFPESPMWQVLDKQVREQCSSVEPFAGGMTSFPISTIEGHYQLSAPTPLPDMQPVKNRMQVLVAPGCIT
jgi:hypothetical protein